MRRDRHGTSQSQATIQRACRLDRQGAARVADDDQTRAICDPQTAGDGMAGMWRGAAGEVIGARDDSTRVSSRRASSDLGQHVRVPAPTGTVHHRLRPRRDAFDRSAAVGRQGPPCWPRQAFERRKALGFEEQGAATVRAVLRRCQAAVPRAAAGERRPCSPAVAVRGNPGADGAGSTGRDPRGRAPGSRSLPDACGSECQ
jgi:hypothetical protein